MTLSKADKDDVDYDFLTYIDKYGDIRYVLNDEPGEEEV